MVKDGYKKTEIGEIPETWDTITFGECFDVLPNNTLSRAELNYDSGDIRNIHYGDVLIKFSSVLDCCNEEVPFVNIENTQKVCRGFLQDGDLIIADTAEDNTVGKATEVIGIGELKVVSGLHTIPCRPKQKDRFAPKWLGYFINHNIYHDQILPYVTGIKVSSISKSGIAETVVAIPAKEEQHVIVDALSDIDALITNLQKLIEKQKAVKQGVMHELLSGKRRLTDFYEEWEPYRIGDIGSFYSGLSGKSKADFGSGDSRYITFLNVLTNAIIEPSITERVNVAENEKQNAVIKEDLFFNTSSETPEEVGMCAVLLEDLPNTYLNSFCFGFRLSNENVIPLFLSYYFNSQEGRNIMRVLAQGATRYNLSKTYFSDTIVLLPPKDEQIAIASIIYDMENSIAALEEKLDKYRKIKAGMMSELLTGKIRLI